MFVKGWTIEIQDSKIALFDLALSVGLKKVGIPNSNLLSYLNQSQVTLQSTILKAF